MKNILQHQLGINARGANNNANIPPLSSNSTTPLFYSFLNKKSEVGKGGAEMANAMKASTQLIANFFSPIQALASKPVFTLVSSGGLDNLFFDKKKGGKGKVIINLFYYIANRNQALSNSTINSLGQVLSKRFGRPVELRLVRVYYPYMNSYILAQYVAINTKRYNFTRIQRAIFTALQVVNQQTLSRTSSDNALPSYITGVKILLSGRLVTERSVPRQTVQTAEMGSFSDVFFSSGGKIGKNVVESASFTAKNKKGSFTVKVWISQLSLTS